MEAVQGKELERIFREEGVIDEDDDDAGKQNTDVSSVGPVQSTKDGKCLPKCHSFFFILIVDIRQGKYVFWYCCGQLNILFILELFSRGHRSLGNS